VGRFDIILYMEKISINKRMEEYDKEHKALLVKFSIKEKGVLIKRNNQRSSWLEKKAVRFLTRRGYVNAIMYEDES